MTSRVSPAPLDMVVRTIWALALIGLTGVAFGLPLYGQSASTAASESSGKPNIALSGCLMRQGYGTLAIADARLDGFGDNAENAKPGASNGSSVKVKAPPRWILDEPGAISQHVGEKVQVTGRTDWSPKKEDAAGDDIGVRDVPHVTVHSTIVLANTCS